MNRRYLVTFDDAVITEAPDPGNAVMFRANDDSIPWGATVFVIDLDAAIKAGAVTRFKLGVQQLRLGHSCGANSQPKGES